MLDPDVCKVQPMDTLTLSELNYEELECLLEFLYTGSLPKEKVEKHVYSLSLAADKYEISYLQKFCDRHMISSMNTSNALDFLEISDICSDISLKESTLNFIAKNMEDIAFSDRYDEFALKNPHLSVQITGASVMEAKRKMISL
jgi:speckle-type POZ protein